MANRLPDIGQSVDRATVGLVFAGNGSQWPGMGAALLRDDAVFRESVSALDAKIRERAGWSVIDALDADTSALTIARIGTAQPLLYALQIGLVDSLRARGLAFGAVCGHSVGEVAAATVVGALDPDQALDLILTRSAAQERTWGQGKMAALALSAIEAEALCAPYDGAVVVAALNSPTSVTLSGDEACLIALGEQAKAAGALFRLLDLDYAFHNRVLDPVRDDLLKALAPLRPRPCAPGYRFFSSVDGKARGGETLDARYWWDNVREPVRFDAAVTAMAAGGVTTFIEIGPHPILRSYLREILQGRSRLGRGPHPIATLSRTRSGPEALQATLDHLRTPPSLQRKSA